MAIPPPAAIPEDNGPGSRDGSAETVAALLLAKRAADAPAGHPGAAGWLADALAADPENPDLLVIVHDASQRHRPADPAAFDASWAQHSGGPVPAWLTVDPGLFRAASEWMGTATDQEEQAYLAAHPELLGAAADLAVGEALRELAEQDADRYTGLRQAAQQVGADMAYRLFATAALATEFTDADLEAQRVMLEQRRADLLGSDVAEVLNSRLDDDNVLARRAVGLLAVARLTDPGPVLDALAEPGLFLPLLRAMMGDPRPDILVHTALVAATAFDHDDPAMATVLFYAAVGLARDGERQKAAAVARNALELDPAQAPQWIETLAAIRPRRSPARALIPVLKSGRR